jgi:hypothetical protein
MADDIADRHSGGDARSVSNPIVGRSLQQAAQGGAAILNRAPVARRLRHDEAAAAAERVRKPDFDVRTVFDLGR